MKTQTLKSRIILISALLLTYMPIASASENVKSMNEVVDFFSSPAGIGLSLLLSLFFVISIVKGRDKQKTCVNQLQGSDAQAPSSSVNINKKKTSTAHAKKYGSSHKSNSQTYASKRGAYRDDDDCDVTSIPSVSYSSSSSCSDSGSSD